MVALHKTYCHVLKCTKRICFTDMCHLRLHRSFVMLNYPSACAVAINRTGTLQCQVIHQRALAHACLMAEHIYLQLVCGQGRLLPGCMPISLLPMAWKMILSDCTSMIDICQLMQHKGMPIVCCILPANPSVVAAEASHKTTCIPCRTCLQIFSGYIKIKSYC